MCSHVGLQSGQGGSRYEVVGQMLQLFFLLCLQGWGEEEITPCCQATSATVHGGRRLRECYLGSFDSSEMLLALLDQD